MCGFLLTSGSDINYHRNHLERISKRGQDSTKTITIKNDLIISHSLLSISSSYDHLQPYALEDEIFRKIKFKLLGKEIDITKDSFFVFNGEIFNLSELKENISRKYEIDLSQTFAEHKILALVLLLDDYEIISKIRGFYSALLVFPQNNLCFLTRDINGIKPLFYSINSDLISVSSMFINENDYVQDKFSKTAGSFYMSYGFIPSPFTLSNKASKVMPGQKLLISLEEYKIIASDFIKRKKVKRVSDFSRNQFNKLFISEIKESLLKRLIHRDNFSICLSGGLDSSFLLSLLPEFLSNNQFKSFTLSLPKSEDTFYVKQVINKFNCKFNIENFSYSTYSEVFSDVIKSMTCPLADTSIFPTFKVLSNASSFSRVCITGDGSDELLGGYSTYSILNKLNNLKWGLKFLSNLGVQKAKRLRRIFDNPYNFYNSIFETEDILNWKEMTFNEIQDQFKELIPNERKIKSLMMFDSCNMLLVDNYLSKVDICSVNNNIECRNPFLDSKFINFCDSIPLKYLLNFKGGKLPIKNQLKSLLGKKFVNRNKEGFAPKLHPLYNREIQIEQQVLELLNEILPNIVECYSKINNESKFKPIYRERIIILGCYLNDEILNNFQNKFLNNYVI